MLRVGKKNASCSVGPTSLAMFCFRANRGLVVFLNLFFNTSIFNLVIRFVFYNLFNVIITDFLLGFIPESMAKGSSAGFT